MNKKTYQVPLSLKLNVAVEGMIATSLSLSEEEGNQHLSNRQGWSSEDWTATEETE
ncbi:MAG: hypothetical protein ACI3YA_02605 [Alloprevotella sp.]